MHCDRYCLTSRQTGHAVFPRPASLFSSHQQLSQWSHAIIVESVPVSCRHAHTMNPFPVDDNKQGF